MAPRPCRSGGHWHGEYTTNCSGMWRDSLRSCLSMLTMIAVRDSDAVVRHDVECYSNDVSEPAAAHFLWTAPFLSTSWYVSLYKLSIILALILEPED